MSTREQVLGTCVGRTHDSRKLYVATMRFINGRLPKTAGWGVWLPSKRLAVVIPIDIRASHIVAGPT